MSYIAMGQELLPPTSRRPLSSFARPVSHQSTSLSVRSSIFNSMEATKLTRVDSRFYSRRVSEFLDNRHASALGGNNQDVHLVLEAGHASRDVNDDRVDNIPSAGQADSHTDVCDTSSIQPKSTVRDSMERVAMSGNVTRAGYFFDQTIKKRPFDVHEGVNFYDHRAPRAQYSDFNFNLDDDNLVAPLEVLITQEVTVEHSVEQFDTADFDQGNNSGRDETLTKIWADGPGAVNSSDRYSQSNSEVVDIAESGNHAGNYTSDSQQQYEDASLSEFRNYKSHPGMNSAAFHPSQESTVTSKSFPKRESMFSLKEHAPVHFNALKSHARGIRRVLSQKSRALISPVKKFWGTKDDSSYTSVKPASRLKSVSMIPGEDQNTYSEQARPKSYSPVSNGADPLFSPATRLLPDRRTSISSILSHFPHPAAAQVDQHNFTEPTTHFKNILASPKFISAMQSHGDYAGDPSPMIADYTQAPPNPRDLIYRRLEGLLHKYPDLKPEINLIKRNMREWEVSIVQAHVTEQGQWCSESARSRYEHDYTKSLLAESYKDLAESLEMVDLYRDALDAEQLISGDQGDDATIDNTENEDTSAEGAMSGNIQTLEEQGAQSMTSNDAIKAVEDPALEAAKRNFEMAQRLQAQSLEKYAARNHSQYHQAEEENIATRSINSADMSHFVNAPYSKFNLNVSSTDPLRDTGFLQELVNSRMSSAAPPPTTFATLRAVTDNIVPPPRGQTSAGYNSSALDRRMVHSTSKLRNAELSHSAGDSRSIQPGNFNQEHDPTAIRTGSSGRGKPGGGDFGLIRRGFSSRSGKSQHSSKVLNQAFDKFSIHDSDGNSYKNGDDKFFD